MRQKKAKHLRRLARTMATGYPRQEYESRMLRNGSIQTRLARCEKLAVKILKRQDANLC